MTRRETLLLRTAVNAGLVVVVAGLVDHTASAVGARFDLTEDRRHTLSPVSRATVANLPRSVTATAYFTPELDPPYHTHKAATLALLDELAAASRGAFVVRVVEPEDAGADEARARGIAPVEFRLATESRAERKAVYLGIALSAGEREAVITPVTSLDTLEYDVVHATRQLVADEDDQKTVGWYTGDGAPDLLRARDDSALGQLRASLAAEHEVVGVTLGGDLGVPDAVDALIVAGPVRPLSERAQYQLDQFVLRGGALGLFVTTARPDLETLSINPADSGLLALAAHLGARIEPGLVLDRRQRDVLTVPVAAGKRKVMVPVEHPLMPIATELSQESPIQRGVQRLTVPFAAPLSLVDPLPPGVEGLVLAWSSPASSAATGLTDLRPDTFDKPLPGERPGPFPLIVALNGTWKTMFADRPVPGDGQGQVFEGAESRLIVVGSSDFVANEPAWVLNAADWLLADPVLTQIRARHQGPPSLAPMEAATRTRWKLGMTAAPLLLIGLLAGAAALRRAR